jgi:hypothetical protein
VAGSIPNSLFSNFKEGFARLLYRPAIVDLDHAAIDRQGLVAARQPFGDVLGRFAPAPGKPLRQHVAIDGQADDQQLSEGALDVAERTARAVGDGDPALFDMMQRGRRNAVAQPVRLPADREAPGVLFRRKNARGRARRGLPWRRRRRASPRGARTSRGCRLPASVSAS